MCWEASRSTLVVKDSGHTIFYTFFEPRRYALGAQHSTVDWIFRICNKKYGRMDTNNNFILEFNETKFLDMVEIF